MIFTILVVHPVVKSTTLVGGVVVGICAIYNLALVPVFAIMQPELTHGVQAGVVVGD